MTRTIDERPLRVFINYRRGDSGGHAGRVYDALIEQFGSKSIFMDVDTIDVGVDFGEVIDQWVGSCDVFIALIGRNWLTATDARGQRRLENPDDLVRLEIEAALERRIRVIPALVQGAEMPPSIELPDSLKQFSRRNAIELSDTRWRSDLDRLLRALKEIAAETGERDASATDSDAETAKPLLGSQDFLEEVDTLPVATDIARPGRSRFRRLVLAGIVTASVLGGVGVALWQFALGSDQKEKAEQQSGTRVAVVSSSGRPKAAYLEEVGSAIGQIGRSAGTIGHILATTGRPSDLIRVRKTAGSELALLQRLRTDLAETAVGESERRAHLHLLRAATSHRRYLALLVRATQDDIGDGLATLPAARATVRNALSHYRGFFAAQPQLNDVISDSGMGDLAGLRAALTAAGGSPSGPSTSKERHFTSVDRLQHCRITSSYVRCGSGPSGQVVLLRTGERATYLGRLGSKDTGGQALALGASIRSSGGTIRCASSSRGITCTDQDTAASFTIGDERYVVSNPSSQAPAQPSTPRGVSRVHSGTFTSVDRRQHCYATNSFVRCGSGPSAEVVQLQAGGAAIYLGVLGSRDNGGPSMPEGTSFQTPAATIECGSSSRGISCTDITGQSKASFTIGDHYHRLSNDTPASPQAGVPSRYAGPFTSVDRRQHCIAEERYVRCGSGPSGQIVELRAGMQASYLGAPGSSETGGSSMPEGTSFRTPSGAIECRSSSRGITCTDLTGTDQSFTIGDHYVEVNGVVTRR